MTVLDLILERARQERTGDTTFLIKGLYFFELRVPASVVSGGEPVFLYPLIINPMSIEMSEPFALDRAYTVDGGLFVEEQGIVARELTIEGNTGFKPRVVPKNFTTKIPNIKRGEFRSFDRTATENSRQLVEKLSGQRHFQFLQDSVFRTYADLKQDRGTSKETELFFHNTKDGESWRVHPILFDSRRSADKNNLYEYTIKLLCSESITSPLTVLTEDKDIGDAFSNPLRTIRSGLAIAQAAVDELTRVEDEVRRRILGGVEVISDVRRLLAATNDFVDGAQEYIKLPLFTFTRIIEVLEEQLALFHNVSTTFTEDIPLASIRTVRTIQDGLVQIASYPEKFASTTDQALERFNAQNELSTSQTRQALLDAEEAGPPSSLSGFSRTSLGTSLGAGDRLRADNELGLGRNVRRYTSAIEHIIEAGDTLYSLAANYLGSTREWKSIAVFNDLKPPFITEDQLPNTLRIGDTILIPTFGRSDRSRDTAVVLGTLDEQSSEEHLLGVDLLVEDESPSGRGQYDFQIDTEGGGVDFKVVRGAKNLEQGIRSRLLTERGTDILYKKVGVGAIVGLGLTIVDLETHRFRVIEGVRADPRVAAVVNVRFLESENPEEADRLIMELDVEPRGLSRPVTVRTSPRL